MQMVHVRTRLGRHQCDGERMCNVCCTKPLVGYFRLSCGVCAQQPHVLPHTEVNIVGTRERDWDWVRLLVCVVLIDYWTYLYVIPLKY